jgi:hypothetical protein
MSTIIILIMHIELGIPGKQSLTLKLARPRHFDEIIKNPMHEVPVTFGNVQTFLFKRFT